MTKEKETLETVQAQWQDCRLKLRELQGDHARLTTQQGGFEASAKEQLAKLVEGQAVAVAELQRRHDMERVVLHANKGSARGEVESQLKATEEDYQRTSTRLEKLGERVQEMLSAELKRDNGTMAAGLGTPKEAAEAAEPEQRRETVA